MDLLYLTYLNLIWLFHLQNYGNHNSLFCIIVFYLIEIFYMQKSGLQKTFARKSVHLLAYPQIYIKSKQIFIAGTISNYIIKFI